MCNDLLGSFVSDICSSFMRTLTSRCRACFILVSTMWVFEVLEYGVAERLQVFDMRRAIMFVGICFPAVWFTLFVFSLVVFPRTSVNIIF